jgi:hypothetical protein
MNDALVGDYTDSDIQAINRYRLHLQPSGQMFALLMA